MANNLSDLYGIYIPALTAKSQEYNNKSSFKITTQFYIVLIVNIKFKTVRFWNIL